MTTQVAPQSTRQGGNARQPAWMTKISQILVESASSQLVPTRNTTGTAKDSTALSVLPKVPFQDRVDPLTVPTDDKFANVERYFQFLLRRRNLTLEQILESHFDEHEKSLIIPVSGPPETVRWQKENSIRYQSLLQTSFKGKIPSLQLKLAMLYFGLPVAPIKIGPNQAVDIMDLDFLEDKVVHEPDPLKFLEDYSVRCYGDTSRRGRPCRKPPFNITFSFANIITERNKSFYKLAPTQKFTSRSLPPDTLLSLRGGTLESDLSSEEDHLAMATLVNPEDWMKLDGGEDTQSDEPHFLVLGFQGAVTCNADYLDFVRAVDRVLSFRHTYDYQISIHAYEVQPSGDIENKAPLMSATGTIFHGVAPPSTDPILKVLTTYYNQFAESAYQPAAMFVHYKGETAPSSPEPLLTDKSVVWLHDATDVTVMNMMYMRVPENLSQHFKPNQFVNGYTNAVKNIFPRTPSRGFEYVVARSDGGGFKRMPGSSYGLLEPPRSVWNEVIQNRYKQRSSKDYISPSIYLNPILDILDESVTVLVADCYNDFSQIQPKDITDVNKDQATINTIRGAVNDSNSGLRDLKPALSAVDVWFPSAMILDPKVPPFKIRDILTPSSQTSTDWRNAAHSIQNKFKTGLPSGPSLIVRPVFKTYTLHANGNTWTVDINQLPLLDFLNHAVQNMFPKELVSVAGLRTRCLHLTQTTWNRDTSSFVVRFETSQEEWSWIVRHITEPDITVTVQDTWDNEWSKY